MALYAEWCAKAAEWVHSIEWAASSDEPRPSLDDVRRPSAAEPAPSRLNHSDASLARQVLSGASGERRGARAFPQTCWLLIARCGPAEGERAMLEPWMIVLIAFGATRAALDLWDLLTLSMRIKEAVTRRNEEERQALAAAVTEEHV